jgi:hypothetical protein
MVPALDPNAIRSLWTAPRQTSDESVYYVGKPPNFTRLLHAGLELEHFEQIGTHWKCGVQGLAVGTIALSSANTTTANRQATTDI